MIIYLTAKQIVNNRTAKNEKAMQARLFSIIAGVAAVSLPFFIVSGAALYALIYTFVFWGALFASYVIKD